MITNADIHQLAEHTAQPVVSMYMPLHRGADARKNAIHVKNAINEANQQLDAWPDGRAALESGLTRAAGLAKDYHFWQRPGHGVAIFVAQNLDCVYRAPVPFETDTFVGSAAQVIPLTGALDDGTTFFILAMSQNKVRLLRGTRSSVFEFELPEAPKRLDELFDISESPQLQFRTINHGNAAGSVGMFHGHGDTERMTDEHLLKFLRAVDEDVEQALRDQDAPLIFAGDTALFGKFKPASNCRTLQDQYVRGNPDDLSNPELHRLAWPLVADRLEDRRRRMITEVTESIEKGVGSTELSTILDAALHARIDHLLLAAGAPVWGRYSPDGAELEILDKRKNGCDDLRNLAAVHTLRGGGVISVLPADALPYESAALARFRF